MKDYLPLVAFALIVFLVGVGVACLYLEPVNGVVPVRVVTVDQPIANETEQAQIVRSVVRDEEKEELRAENATLKMRVQELEQLRPTTKGELAVVLSIKEEDLTYRLDRSELLSDAAKLAEAINIAGAKNVWGALQTEAKLFRSMADFKEKNPCDQQNRALWHDTLWVPFYSSAVTATCDELYRLSIPSTLVESFRNRMSEGM